MRGPSARKRSAVGRRLSGADLVAVPFAACSNVSVRTLATCWQRCVRWERRSVSVRALHNSESSGLPRRGVRRSFAEAMATPSTIEPAMTTRSYALVIDRPHALARAQVLQVRLQPQIARYQQLARRADEILNAHVFADSEGVLGFVWDLFLGPTEDRAFNAARHMSPDERQVFVDLQAVLDDVERRGGQEGVLTVLRSFDDHFLTTDLELSDAVVGVLRALGKA
jgi:hypothetical protein